LLLPLPVKSNGSRYIALFLTQIAAIGRTPPEAALQHLQRDEPPAPENSNLTPADDSSTKTGDTAILPMTIAPSISPVNAKLVKQIQAGGYFELALLLTEIDEVAGCSPLEDRQRQKTKHISTILEWLQCFTAYSGVIAAAQPERAQDLLGYQAVILDARMRYEGQGWLNYDRRFRQAAAADPTKKWSPIQSPCRVHNYRLWAS